MNEKYNQQSTNTTRKGSTKIAKLVPRDLSENLGKLPPQALDLEEAVLGALMLEKNAMMEIAGFLKSEHFYTEQHKEIFQALEDLFGKASPIDMRTVVAQLRTNGKLEIIGGAHYIAELTSRVSSAANIVFHARIIIEMSMKRGVITMASEMQQDAYDETMDVFDLMDKANLNLQEILDGVINGRAEKSIKEITLGVIKNVQARQSGVHTGVDSGFTVLDALLNGFNTTNLIIIAARPGMGKTAFAIQAAKQIAQRGIPVGVFSLEMADKELIERILISESEIDPDKVKKGKLEEHEWARFIHSAGAVSAIPFYLDDTPFLNIVELRARAMRLVAKYKIKILVVDYLQLIKGTGRAGGNRDQEIGEITRTLKGIAKELDIPVIALSQLGRGTETRGGSKRPQLSDLRESGNIEQDADVVMFLYRPEYYKITQDEDGLPTNGLCEIIVAKHRNGSLDTVKLKFVGKFTKFSDWVMGGERMDQSQYVLHHYKRPDERPDSDFEGPQSTDDLPF